MGGKREKKRRREKEGGGRERKGQEVELTISSTVKGFYDSFIMGRGRKEEKDRGENQEKEESSNADGSFLWLKSWN